MVAWLKTDLINKQKSELDNYYNNFELFLGILLSSPK